MECNCVKPIFLKDGSYSKVGDSVGLNLTKLVQSILKENNIGNCDCTKEDLVLKLGTYRQGVKGKGLHLNKLIKDILCECGIDSIQCSSKCIKDYVIFDGYYIVSKDENKQNGLFLNKAIRDILRDCGVQCIYCFENPGC